MEHRFKKAIHQVQQVGYEDIKERLIRERDTISSDTYRIAVVGEFKTFKSTLINKVFLKENVLFTDIMEATAVPTEIRYGPEKILEVIPYPSDKENVEPLKIENPTANDIRRYTSAPSPEERAGLAQKISRVRLIYPSVNLAGLTLFDTPGINSINEAVIATTYRIIPESDLVLFVTTAKQLSNIEVEFLTRRVFSEGITRMIVVIAYDPLSGTLSSKQKDHLTRTIRSQLANIGRGSVPVEMVNVRDDPTVKADLPGFRERIESETQADPKKAVSSVIGALLGKPKPTELEPDEAFVSDGDENTRIAVLEEKLIRYIRENVRPARMEKASLVLRNQLQLAHVQCSTELAALNKSETERQQLSTELQQKEIRLQQEFAALSGQIREELNAVQNRFTQNVNAGLDQIVTSYTQGFDSCRDVGELQDRLNKAEILIKTEIEELFLGCSMQIQKDWEALSVKYRIKNRDILNPWQTEVSRDLSLNGGILAGVPPVAVIAADFSLFILFGPFRLAQILIRLLANEIPFLNNLMPASVAASVLKKNLKKSLAEQFKTIKNDVEFRIHNTFKIAGEQLLHELKQSAESQMNSVRKGLEEALRHQHDQYRMDALTGFKTDIEEMLAG